MLFLTSSSRSRTDSGDEGGMMVMRNSTSMSKRWVIRIAMVTSQETVKQEVQTSFWEVVVSPYRCVSRLLVPTPPPQPQHWQLFPWRRGGRGTGFTDITYVPISSPGMYFCLELGCFTLERPIVVCQSHHLQSRE